jgi:hypothetical protein
MNSQNKNLSLWKLTNEHQKLLAELYDPETGEVNEIVQAKLDQLEPSIEKKCIAVTQWIRKMESEERELDALLHEVENRKAAYNKEVERHVKYLEMNMERKGIKEIVCPYFTVRLKKNRHSTDITDQNLIPDKFIKTRIIPEKIESNPDKNLIKEEVISTGIQVPGAYVYQKNKLEISTNKLYLRNNDTNE